MKIVVDSNILFSAIIKENSIIREILSLEIIEFYMCWFSIIEITKYKDYLLKKSKLSEEKFPEILGLLNQNIKFVKNEKLHEKLEEAINIMQNIDLKDAPILAAALVVNPDFIWSNDIHLKKQNRFKVLNTAELLILVNLK